MLLKEKRKIGPHGKGNSTVTNLDRGWRREEVWKLMDELLNSHRKCLQEKRNERERLRNARGGGETFIQEFRGYVKRRTLQSQRPVEKFGSAQLVTLRHKEKKRTWGRAENGKRRCFNAERTGPERWWNIEDIRNGWRRKDRRFRGCRRH